MIGYYKRTGPGMQGSNRNSNIGGWWACVSSQLCPGRRPDMGGGQEHRRTSNHQNKQSAHRIGYRLRQQLCLVPHNHMWQWDSSVPISFVICLNAHSSLPHVVLKCWKHRQKQPLLWPALISSTGQNSGLGFVPQAQLPLKNVRICFWPATLPLKQPVRDGKCVSHVFWKD